MILAGDIGGTNARLAVFDVLDGRFSLISASVFPSREYSSLDEIVSKFVRTANVHPHAACFGVAGPVRNGRVEASNLPWIIESKRLAEELDLKKALLINDLEANAWGIAFLDPADLVSLNQVKGTPVGNQAVISAGTGLGEAGMYWDGTKHLVFASEGGHADFAPRNELETELLRYLRVRFGHVSYERIVSGPGLVNVFNFLRDTGRGVEPKWLADEMLHSDPAAAISRAAIDGKCGLSEQAIDLFVSIYGAEAGNLALKIMATGGIYLGGGIAPKMLPKLAGPLFMEGFLSKGRMQHLLEAIPVRVITNDKVALLGAARYAVVRTTA
ncbi:MAG: glucokinase [Acidobacteria bacterium]|jgi:glucokinase|nr:MAG: glucokinase [Acidobacteriales bacterium 13_2_20CM_2_55_5]PYX03374.1 MAG: glucokinase [Acidobacteriota bacterium]PYX08172.1 MAG: glucokinase [Acidobacteriota bacterium]PYX16172.1 MAG: glucokinase [Acidobacteriota bacterium]